MKITKEDLPELTKKEILEKAGKNKTEIFKTYEDFSNRPDKSVNGVSPEFAEKYPDWRVMNATNKGCYNCTDCYTCHDCTCCNDCTGCTDCTGCYTCHDCTCCYRCADCTDCAGCAGCNDCYACTDLSNIRCAVFNVKLSKEEYESVKEKLEAE